MTDNIYMLRALELAALAKGRTGTNPMVGCVIVHDNKIISEGYHHLYGGVHAEVDAINNVKESDLDLLSESTLYVNLEPCSHFGKTPPCTDLIIKYNIKRVVVGCQDTFAEVNGAGIEKLRAHGIDVTVGVLEMESKMLNQRFFCYHNKKRPYIILKWAQTCDGYLDNDRDASSPMNWLTNSQCRYIVHKMRAEESAILVGSNTVVRDNPSLTVRDWSGENPTRLVIDRELKLSREYNIFDEKAKTYVINGKIEDDNHIKIDSSDDNDFMQELMQKLHERGITSLIVEGGSKVLNMFIDSELYDEAVVFISPISLKEMKYGDNITGVRAPDLPKGDRVSDYNESDIIIKIIVNNSVV